jgi:hypothetical protein
MWYLTGINVSSGLFWTWGPETTFRADDEEGLRIGFLFSSPNHGMSKREALKAL